MTEINEAIQEVFDLLDLAAKNYPIKALAAELYSAHNKAESTLRGELNQQPGHKLGLETSIHILKRTGDLRALDRVEAIFDRVAFRLPRPQGDKVAPFMALVSRVTKEFGEHLAAVAEAMYDGRVTRGEAEKCLKELKEVIQACTHLQAYLNELIKAPE